MTLFETSAAIFALLATPGPTNTLLAVAGADRGVVRALRLIPAEAMGYSLAVIPMMIAGEALLGELPGLRAALTALAALWVLWLAVTLWRDPGVAQAGEVTPKRVFVTTLANPKALVFGLVLLPASGDVAVAFAVFLSLIVVVAFAWATLGASLAHYSPMGQSRTRRMLRKGAAFWLAALSLGLAVNAVSG